MRRISFFLCLAATLFAQDVDLYGQVRTTQGARLGYAQVRLQDKDTVTTANAAGSWVLSNIPKPASSAVLSSSSLSLSSSSSTPMSVASSSSAGTTATLPGASRGYAVHFAPAGGELVLSLAYNMPVKVEAFDLQGQGTLLYAGVVTGGSHVLHPLRHAALQAGSGVVLLRAQVGSAFTTWQVQHLRGEVLGARLLEDRAAPVIQTAATEKAEFVALEATSAPVDQLTFSAPGYTPFQLDVLNYLQGALGNVYLEVLPEAVPLSSSSSVQLANVLVEPSAHFSVSVSGYTVQIGVPVRVCLSARSPQAVFEGFKLDGVDQEPGLGLEVQAASLCRTFTFGSGAHTLAVRSRLATASDSVTWTAEDVEGGLSATYLYDLSGDKVLFGAPRRLPRGQQYTLCATPRSGYRVRSLEFSGNGGSVDFVKTGKVCHLVQSDLDSTVRVHTALPDTVEVLFVVEPGLSVLGSQESFVRRVQVGDSLRYDVRGGDPQVLLRAETLRPSQDTTVTTTGLDPTAIYRIIVPATPHAKLGFKDLMTGISYDYGENGFTQLVAQGMPAKLSIQAQSGWDLESVTPPEVLSPDWIPTSDVKVSVVVAPHVASAADTITLIADTTAATYRFVNLARNQLSILRDATLQTRILTCFKEGQLPVALKVNGILQPLQTFTSVGNVSVYFNANGKDTARIRVPTGPEVQTLEVLFGPAPAPLTLRLPDGWTADRGTVTVTSTLQGVLTLPATVSANELLDIQVTHPTKQVYDLTVGNVRVAAGGSMSYLAPLRGRLGLDAQATEAVLDYQLRDSLFVIVKSSLGAANITNTSRSKTLAESDTLWDGQSLSSIFTGTPGQYMVGWQWGAQTFHYEKPSSWKAPGAALFSTLDMEGWGLASLDTVAWEPIVRQVPAYLVFQDTTSPTPITYKTGSPYGADAMIPVTYPLGGKTIQLFPSGVPAGQVMHLYSRGMFCENNIVNIPWWPDTTAQTIVMDLKPVFRAKDSLLIVLQSPVPLYLGEAGSSFPNSALPLVLAPDTLRRAEGDTVALCHDGNSMSHTNTPSLPFSNYSKTGTQYCGQAVLPFFPPSLAGQEHDTLVLAFQTKEVVTSGVARVLRIEGLASGEEARLTIGTKQYASGDTLQSNGFYGSFCLTHAGIDSNKVYRFTALAPNGQRIATGESSVEQRCGTEHLFSLNDPATFGMDTLVLQVTSQTRQRVAISLAPAFAQYVTAIYLKPGTTPVQYLPLTWNSATGVLDTTLYQNYAVSNSLCFATHDSLGIMDIGYAAITSSVYHAFAGNAQIPVTCVSLDSSALSQASGTPLRLTLRATLERLPAIAFADSSTSYEQVSYYGAPYAPKPQYFQRYRTYNVVVSNDDPGSTITSFTIGGKSFTANLGSATTLGTTVTTSYATGIEFRPSEMLADADNVVKIVNVRTAK